MKGVVPLTMLLGAVSFTAAAMDLSGLPQYTPDANADRSQIPEVYQWDLSQLCSGDAEFERLSEQAAGDLERLAGMADNFATPDGLVQALQLAFKLDRDINVLTLYANLLRERETTNQVLIANHQQTLSLLDRLMAQGPVLRAAILARSPDELQAAYQDAPALAEFRPFIDALYRRKDRVLGAEAEQVLSLAGDNLWAQIDLNEIPYAAEDAFAALISELPLPVITDATGAQVRLTFANYPRLRSDDDRDVRRRAVAGVMTTLRDFENTLAATLAGQAEFDVFLARARGYDTALEAYLDKDDLDPAVYHNLIATVRAKVEPLHRLVGLRKKLMKVDAIHLYDLYVPMVEGVSRDIPYSEAAETLLAALEPLGPEYGKLLAEAIDPRNGWIDLYPSRDKRSGASSSSVFGAHPFVKMNYQNSFDDVSTLAHELGHALHSHLSMTTQPYVSHRYVPFLAEIASTCNEVLLSKHMIANASSRAERAWQLSELVETIRSTIYRQTLFAEFELRLHELVEAGTPVTATALNDIYAELIGHYYGPAYAIDDNDPLEWAYIPHFYWKYYVYNYATGLSSGAAIAERVSSGDASAREAYLQMLRSGCAEPPLQLLRSAGVDLTTPAPIEAALGLFDRTVRELEQLLLSEE